MNYQEYTNARLAWSANYKELSQRIRVARVELKAAQHYYDKLGWDHFWKSPDGNPNNAPGWVRYQNLPAEDQYILHTAPLHNLIIAQRHLDTLVKKADEELKKLFAMKEEAGIIWHANKSRPCR